MVQEIGWHGQRALVLEGERIRVVTTPSVGAKIVSIRDRASDYEWLREPFGREFGPIEYGASFVDQDMSGWDEMFPTIGACIYPVEGPYYGVSVPDHGEVWSSSWTVEPSPHGEICLSVGGSALPYTMRRIMRLTDEASFSLSYEVVNTGSEPFFGLWAAHPQFVTTHKTRVVLPSEVTTLVNVEETADWPRRNQSIGWPYAVTASGDTVDVRMIGSAERGSYRKFYLPPEQGVSGAGLTDSGRRINLSWDASTLRYLGLWVDEGGFSPQSTVALEPSNGFYDQIPTALQAGRIVRFAPGQVVTWELTVTVG